MKNILKKNINQKLKGNSGSKLLIYSDKIYKIRKQSTNKQTSLRLENQYKKITNLKKNNPHKFIYFPETYETGYNKSNFFYDMQYINGENFSELILKSSYKKTTKLFKNVLDFILLCKKNSSKNYYDSKRILVKINELETKNRFKSKFFKKLFNQLKKFNWKKVPFSINHGDLSLENILVKREKVFFIDSSKNFVESYYLDLSKLLFDFICNWSLRNSKKIDSIIEINSIKQNYINFLYKNFNDHDLTIIKMLTILDFLRVLNYSKDINHLSLLKKKLKKFYDNFNNSVLW